MYYNIEVFNNLNIYFIVIIVNRTKYLTPNYACILMLNSDPDLHFVLAVLSKCKTDFEICSKLNLLIKQTRKFLRHTIIFTGLLD